MRVGDRLLYYVTGRMAFAATVTVASPMYEDHTPTWRTARRDEDYPWRVHIRRDLVLDDPDWVPAKELAYRLDYVRKWPPSTGRLRSRATSTPCLARTSESSRTRSRAARGQKPIPRGLSRLKELYTFHFQNERRAATVPLRRSGSWSRSAIVRAITHLIRAGVGPFHNLTSGGLHIHHLVWGILILILVG